MVESKFSLDTNIWIGIFHKKRIDRFIESLIEKNFLLFSCTEQHKELLHVLYFYDHLQQIIKPPYEDYVEIIKALSETKRTNKRFALLGDYKDNYMVDLAVQTSSTLVTDDRHFNLLKKLSSPKINVINRVKFYQLLGW
jgi:putative PIN family toxin of toxin-antitoxin system